VLGTHLPEPTAGRCVQPSTFSVSLVPIMAPTLAESKPIASKSLRMLGAETGSIWVPQEFLLVFSFVSHLSISASMATWKLVGLPLEFRRVLPFE
jgi:hypothetical protein